MLLSCIWHKFSNIIDFISIIQKRQWILLNEMEKSYVFMIPKYIFTNIWLSYVPVELTICQRYSNWIEIYEFWTQLNEKLLRLLLRIEMYFKLWKLVMKMRLMHSDFLCSWLNSAGWLILLKYLKYINYTRLFIYNYLFDKAFDIHTDISVAFCGQFVRIGVSV